MLLNCFVKYLLISLMAIALAVRVSPRADEPSKCAAAPHVLWGDGEHDDTAALNAWFRGENVIWVHSHEVVGDELADRTFLLSSAIYISSGTGRKLERFRMIWTDPPYGVDYAGKNKYLNRSDRGNPARNCGFGHQLPGHRPGWRRARACRCGHLWPIGVAQWLIWQVARKDHEFN